VVADAADGRDRVRRDLDQVVPLALRERQGTRRRDDAQLLAVSSYEADGGDTDLVVDPELGYERTPFVSRLRPAPERGEASTEESLSAAMSGA
jgi:hypothetical protein